MSFAVTGIIVFVNKWAAVYNTVVSCCHCLWIRDKLYQVTSMHSLVVFFLPEIIYFSWVTANLTFYLQSNLNSFSIYYKQETVAVQKYWFCILHIKYIEDSTLFIYIQYNPNPNKYFKTSAHACINKILDGRSLLENPHHN